MFTGGTIWLLTHGHLNFPAWVLLFGFYKNMSAGQGRSAEPAAAAAKRAEVHCRAAGRRRSFAFFFVFLYGSQELTGSRGWFSFLLFLFYFGADLGKTM